MAAEAYRTALTIRRFEERCLDLRARDEIAGSIHLALGQEAIPTGALAALGPEDRVVATYRGHGWAIACGVPLGPLLAEICQRRDGVNGGRAGSPYLTAPAYRFVGENSIVGAGLPLGCGLALALQRAGAGGVALVSFGDGASSQGATHEGLVMATALSLPVLFVCEDNGWSEMTATSAIVREADLGLRAKALGMAAVTVDGDDPAAVERAVAAAAERARDGGGPTFLHCLTHRLGAHYHADIEHYRSDEDRAAAREADPVARLRAALPAAEAEAIESEVGAQVDGAETYALASPHPDPATAHEHVVATPRAAAPTPESGEETTFGLAVNAALRRALTERPEVFVFGEDCGDAGGIFGCTRGLQRDFGADRCFDTPIAEAAILGTALGASLEGLRPVAEVMWMDFLLVALDQLVNQAANQRYLARGERSAPLVVRMQQGATPGSCAQHSQSLEALLAHVPGLRVGLPSTPQDAFGMLLAAIDDPDPCIVIEARALYGTKGPVALDAPVEPVGGARLRREGSDLAIVTWGTCVAPSLAAAELLASEGLEASVLDLRWLSPLDDEALSTVAAHTGRLLVAHEANLTGGFGAEVAARVSERCWGSLDAPVMRVGAPDVRIPSAPSLQAALLPDAAAIAAAARALCSE